MPGIPMSVMSTSRPDSPLTSSDLAEEKLQAV